MTKKQEAVEYWTRDLWSGKACHGDRAEKPSNRFAKVVILVTMIRELDFSTRNLNPLTAGIEFSPPIGSNVQGMAPGHHFQMSNYLW